MSFSGFEEIVDLLLRNGANVNAVSLKGQTALKLAALNGNLDQIMGLIDLKSIDSFLGQRNIVDMLINYGVTIKQSDIAKSNFFRKYF